MRPLRSHRFTDPFSIVLHVLRAIAGFSGMIRCILLIALASGDVVGGEPEISGAVPRLGESLRYKVKWHFVRLGTITIKTFRDSTCTSPEEYRVAMIVESNPDLSIVSIREYNESFMNRQRMGSRGFRARHIDGDDCLVVRHDFDEQSGVLVSTIRDGRSGAVTKTDTARNVSTYVDGPSLFLYARSVSRSRGRVSVPTFVTGRMSSTEMYFDGGIEEVEIDACESPVRTRKFAGVAHWTGGTSIGINGEFKGWLSDDEDSVPIRAEMKTLLGPITLELEDWRRDGWTPHGVLHATNN